MKQSKPIFAFILFPILSLSFVQTRAQNPIPNAKLNVTVLDSKKQPIQLLGQNDLQVIEDKKPQKILTFARDERPVNYGLVVDSTGSIRTQLRIVMSLAQRVIDQSMADDSGFLMRFIDTPNITMLVDSTSDKPRLKSGLREIVPMGGQTALYDAVYMGIESLVEANGPGQDKRNVLILISDGENRFSSHNLDELRDLIKRTEVQIYVFGLVSELPYVGGLVRKSGREQATEFIDEITTLSGGRAFYITREADVTPSIEAFSHSLRNQYLIGYQPDTTGSNGLRKVEVKVAPGPNKAKRSALVRRYKYYGDNSSK